MSKKNNKIRKNTKNKLGIKVGDWFEDTSNSDPGIMDFFMVKSLNQTSVRFVEISTYDGELSEVLYGDYDINNLKKVKNILEYGPLKLKLKKIGGDEARNRLKKINGVSLLLECFGVDQKKVSPQNPSSTQSTKKPMTAKDLGIEVGDWFEIPQIYAESKGKDRRFLRVEKVTHQGINFKEVNVKPTNPDIDHTIEVDEEYWLIEYFNKNADGTFFWETEKGGRLDFERRDIDVVRKEVTSCLNLEIEDELRHLNLLEIKPEEKLKKSEYLKYVKDNEVYYLHSPKYQKKEIQGQEKFCVIASGITIINNRINHHSCNGDELNLIRLMFNNEEEFFNKVTEISEYEYHTLWHDLI